MNSLKNTGLLIICLSIVSALFSQQHPSYTQYTFNRFALNPAVAGLKPCATTHLGNRRQWLGFEGAPTTYLASFNTRLNRTDKYPKNFHGVGLQIVNDKMGFTSTTYIKAAYAYHLKLWKNYHLSVGMFAGIHNLTHAYNSIRVPNKALDPAFNSEENRTYIYPEISPGGFMYNRNFFLGLSMIQLFPARTGEIGTNENKLSSHYFLSGGYRFRGQKIDIMPSLLMSFSPFASPTLDLTLIAEYQNKISFGLGSKYLNSAYALLSVELFGSMSVGYSFEYALTTLNEVAPTTHEIMLVFSNCLGETKKTKFSCPAYQ